MAIAQSPLSGSPGSDGVKTEHNAPVVHGHGNGNGNNHNGTKPKSKPRKRVNTAEKRHQHNAIERQRRETLNGKFLGLARLLPSLASHRRPSKSAIVNGSIAHLTHQRDQRLMAARLLRQLCAERDALAKECNEWRVANNFQPKEINSAWSDEMEQVCDVEKEVFGNFATMGQEDDDEDQDENTSGSVNNDLGGSHHSGSIDMREMSLEQASLIASSLNSNGLITPRSSADMDPLTHIFGGLNKLHQQQQQQQHRQQPNLQGFASNWSNDFSFNPTNGSLSNTAATSLPFSAFMSDGMDSISDSPATSQHTGLPTPPTSADFVGFTQTPSPRSSNSFEEMTVNGQQQQSQQQHQQRSQTWSEQQLVFLQSVQQQQLQRQAVGQMPQSTSNQGFNPLVFNGNNDASTGYGASSNAFTQNLIASMFPQQSNVHVGNAHANTNGILPQQPLRPQPQHQQSAPVLSRAQSDSMEAWRKLAIGGMMSRGNDGQPTVDELKNAIRAGMGIGMNMGGIWEPSTVKGY